MFTAQKQKSTELAIVSLSASASITVISANFAGMGADMCQRRSASLYFFPAEAGEAARQVTLNQGWFSSNSKKRWPTIPVAPMTPTLNFFIS